MATTKDSDRTVLMGPEELPDPNATRLYDPNATQAAPTRVASRNDWIPESQKGASPEDEPAPADGIDAMSSPYFSPVAPEDLTTAHPVVTIDSPVESLSERRRKFPAWAVALIVVVVLLGAGGAAYATYRAEIWGGKTVPSVVGLSEADARAALERAGFVVEVEYRPGDENVGEVLGVIPEEGSRADASAPVTLTVAGERVIPQVVGMSESDATSALYASGAADVLVTRINSEKEPGTVLSVEPPEGSAFLSTDQVTLTVAQPFSVPDVMGMGEDEALELLESQGLEGHVSYVPSEGEDDVVVDVEPSVGTEVEPGAVIELSVSSSWPDSPARLADYFDAAPEELAAFLDDAGYELLYGARYASGGNAHAVYRGESGDMLHITDTPESGHYAGDSSGDVLAAGAGIGGVRYAFSSETLPEGAGRESEEGVRAVMEACGFEGLLDTCTQDEVMSRQGVSGDWHFICAYGQQGGHTWAVRIGGYGTNTGVVALVAPTSHFSAIDLSQYDGSICDYVASIDLFTG